MGDAHDDVMINEDPKITFQALFIRTNKQIKENSPKKTKKNNNTLKDSP